VRRVAHDDRAAVPVLLLHGWQASADLNFAPLFGPLSALHPVIAPDLRGHGRSLYPEEPFTIEDAADDAAAVLGDLGVAAAIILGYSLGTAVAQMMVARHRSVVAGIVLMGGELAPRRRPHEMLYDRVAGWASTGQRISNGRWASHRIVSKSARENPALEQHRDWLAREMERGHTASLRAAGRALASFDGRPIASAHPNVPAVVVVTERDRLVRASRQRDLARAWHAKELSFDADHDAPLARPAEFVATAIEAIELIDA
jgi:pimeloyl-ACP methyl ester carboxylesterase